LLERTTLSYVQYTDHHVTVHQQSYHSTYNGVRSPRSNAEALKY